MKKILGVVGSPRRNGNTHILVSRILDGAGKAGARTEILFLDDLHIQECDGCHTYLANTQFDTIRLKLLKIGAEVRELKTKLHFIFPASCPVKNIFATMVRNIVLVT